MRAVCLLLCSCALAGCRRGFEPGDCVEYLDAEGTFHGGGDKVMRTPMRVLGKAAEGKYLVEWTTTVEWTSTIDRDQHRDVQHYKETVPEKDGASHLVKVLCK